MGPILVLIIKDIMAVAVTTPDCRQAESVLSD